MPAPLLLSLALARALLVIGPELCPAPSAVDARVREILGLAADQVLAERATIQREGAALRVTVRGSDDSVLGERLLPADGNCEELSGAVAVVLATWISDVHPEYLGALPAPAPVAAPELPPVDARPVVERRPSARATRSRNLHVDGALGANVSAAQAAPFGALGLRISPKNSGLGGGVSLMLTAARRVPLGDGSVQFFRWPLALGPILHLPLGATALDVQAGAALAWLQVAGVDFTAPAARDGFAAGAFAAARFSVGSGGFVPFAELSSTLWQSSVAFVQRGHEKPSVSLPRLELYGSLGAALRVW